LKAVEISGLSFTYETGDMTEIRALQDINLEVEAGKKVVFLGANGSGKTTLFYHLNGLHLPREGEVKILGIEVGKKSVKEVRRRVGMVFENPDNQLISTTVYDDVAFGLRNYRWSEEAVQEKVQEALEKVQAGDLAESSPYHLSWGQKKRVALAGVLALEPEILVLDEPFSGLDPGVSGALVSLLDRLNGEGKTVIAAAHDVDLAYRWADEVVILSRGQIINRGSPEILTVEEDMKEASLEVPVLAKIFENTPYRPRSVEEARAAIDKLVEGDTY